jgi:hypothetical protein
MDVLAPCAECYDPAIGRWRPVATPLSRRSGGSAVILEGKILICGGDTVTVENQVTQLPLVTHHLLLFLTIMLSCLCSLYVA